MLSTSYHVYKAALGSAALAGVFLALSPTDARAQLATDVACFRCIETIELQRHAVSQAKLAPGAVSRSKIVDGAVTAAKLAPDAVFEHIIVVRADPLDTIGNCDAIRDALTGIVDNDADHRYLVHLEPGTYDCGATPLQMKDYVGLQGSGRDFTIVTGSVIGVDGVINAADHSELSRLSLENIGNASNALVRALNIDSVSFRVTDVAVYAENSTSAQAINVDGATVVLTNVTAEAGGVTVAGGEATGIQVVMGASAELVNVTARAGDGPSVQDCGLLTNIGLSGGPLVARNSVFGGPYAVCNNDPSDTLNLVSTQLDGATSNLGTLTCVGAYDGAYVALDATCS